MREADLERRKREWERKEMQVEEQRSSFGDFRLRQQEEMSLRMRHMQDNNHFMQNREV